MNNNPSTSTSWELDNMGNQLFHFDHQASFDVLHHPIQIEPFLQAHGHAPPASLLGGQLEGEQEDEEALGAMKEMMYKIAAMQPVDIDPSTIKKPKRRNVRISDDPQSIAARLRRERISERIRILQRLVPGGTKMDTASMLDEAIRYVKFLKRQVQELQSNQQQQQPPAVAMDWAVIRPDPHGLPSSSSSSAAMGGHAGLGFGFTGHGSRDHMRHI